MSCMFWDRPDKVEVGQEDNALESIATAIVRSYSQGKYTGTWLETCGPSSLEACLRGLGVDQSQAGRLQPSDYYSCVANDPKRVNRSGWTLPKHRYLEVYPIIVPLLYPELKCEVVWLPVSRTGIRALLERVLVKTQSVAIVNTADPGHYIACLHLDSTGRIYYNDSWLGNYWNRAKTHYRSVMIDTLIANMRAGIVVIERPIPSRLRPDGPEVL